MVMPWPIFGNMTAHDIRPSMNICGPYRTQSREAARERGKAPPEAAIGPYPEVSHSAARRKAKEIRGAAYRRTQVGDLACPKLRRQFCLWVAGVPPNPPAEGAATQSSLRK